MSALRSAVVGVGYLGRFHAQKHKLLTEQGKVNLIAVCDVNTGRRLVAEELGVDFYTEPRDLIGKIDCVTIASHSTQHFAIAKMFLEAGVHVLVEKPATTTSKELQDLVELSEQSKAQFFVGQSERFNPTWRWMQDLLATDRWTGLEIIRHAPYAGRGADVSVQLDLMIHDLDLLTVLTKGQPLNVKHATSGKLFSEADDWAQVWLQDSLQRPIFISSLRGAPRLDRVWRLWGQNNCQHFAAICDFQNGEVFLGDQKNTVGKADQLMLETEAFIAQVQHQREVPPLARGLDLIPTYALLERCFP